MDTVKQMLEIKGRKIWSIGASGSVYEAVEMMAEMEVGALAVVDNDDHLTGIISERDSARKVRLKNKSSRETRVADIMTTDVISVSEQSSLDNCMALMIDKKIRHLPVLNGETLVAMLTIGDLLKITIREQSTTIEELESYIMEETGGSG